MTSDDKKVVLLRYFLDGGLLSITIEDTSEGKESVTQEVVGLKDNEFGIFNDEEFTPIEDVTFKQFLCLADSITEEELTYSILNKQMEDVKEEDTVWM